MPQAQDPKKSKWAWDTKKERRIYVGNKSEWNPEETKKRRWTEPVVTGATKAPHGHQVFLSGRLRCCNDRKECGVQVKVIQGEYQDWHYKRVWNRGKNSKYQFKCKNEANVSGVSRFHHTVVNEIHRCLAEGRPVLGKTIAELHPPELPVRELAGKVPDVYVKFNDGSYLAIEVVYTHAPDREVHEEYEENMVDIRLMELDEIHDDAAFNRWVQADGVWKLFLAEVEPAQRRARWEARQRVFDVQDDNTHRLEVEQRISKCREEFGFPYGGDETTVVDLDDIDAWFEEESQRRALRGSIDQAIRKNRDKYGWLEVNVEDFSSPDDVNKFFEDHFKALNEKKKVAERASKKKLKQDIQKEKRVLEKELDMTIKNNFETLEELRSYGDKERQKIEQQRLEDELAPLISSLLQDCGIRVRRRFKNREEFDVFDKKERKKHRIKEARKQIPQAIRSEYDTEVQTRVRAYKQLKEKKFQNYTYPQKWDVINDHMRQIKDLLKRVFIVDDWKNGKPKHRVLTNGTPKVTEMCSKLDETCEKVGKHRCHEMTSEEAEKLLESMEQDLYDPALDMLTQEQRKSIQNQSRARRVQKSLKDVNERLEQERKEERERAQEEERKWAEKKERREKRKAIEREKRKKARLEKERAQAEEESKKETKLSNRQRRKQGNQRAKPIRGRRAMKPPVSVDTHEEE